MIDFDCFVFLDQFELGIICIILNCFSKLNVFIYEFVIELYEVFEQIDVDYDCCVVVFMGVGCGFCVGLDFIGFGQVLGIEEQG